MLSIGLHTRIIGRPGRIGGLQQLVQHVCSRIQGGCGAWVPTREQIARHFIQAVPTPEAL